MTNRRSRQTSNMNNLDRKKRRAQERERRKLLLESLEERRLLAIGPRLAGIQPSDGALLHSDQVDVRVTSPRDLTINFDENQQIDPASLGGIRVLAAGGDRTFSDGNEVTIQPGFVGVNKSPQENQVVVRFAEALPDDVYRVEIFGKPNTALGIPALKNLAGDAFVPSNASADRQSVDFELDLAPQIVAVVPQPVRRNSQGGLVQSRNTIEVYFNDDKLFVRNSDVGSPTFDSAENPDFYQLIYSNDTVRNTDDVVVKPASVVYTPGLNMATLTFAQNLDQLVDPNNGAVIGPGTFRLRIGTNESAPLPPLSLSPVMQVSTDFNTGDQVVVQFSAVRSGESDVGVLVSKHDLGPSRVPLVNVVGNRVLLDLNNRVGSETRAIDVVNAINSHPVARSLVVASINAGDPNADVATPAINYSPIVFSGLGSSFDTATDLTDDTDLGAVIIVGGNGGTFIDGDFFKITDGSNLTRTFEFDNNVPSVLNDRNAVGITFNSQLTQAEMAALIRDAINGASFGVSAQLAGNTVHLAGELSLDLSASPAGISKGFENNFDNGLIIQATSGGDSFAEGQTFVVEEATGTIRTFELDAGFTLNMPAAGGASITDGQTLTISDGVLSVQFEFDDPTVSAGVAPGNVPVLFSASDNNIVVGGKLAAALLAQIQLGNINGMRSFDLGNGRINIGGVPGSSVNVGAIPGVSVSGQPGVTTPGAIAVSFVPHASFTSNDVARAITNAVNGAGLGISALASGSRVQLNGERDVRIGAGVNGLTTTIQGRFDTGPVLKVTTTAAAIQDGQSISIRDDRSVLRVFEFDRDGVLNDPTAVPIAIVGTETPREVAQKLAAAVNGSGFHVSATALADTIYLTNDRNVALDPSLRAISSTSQGLVINSEIGPGSYLLDSPGGNNDPGHRDIPEEVGGGAEQHINSKFGDNGADATPGVTTIFYNFRADYGQEPGGTQLLNAITPEQKERAREAFQLWSEYLGVQFLESEKEGITLATGDLRALDTTQADVLDYGSFNFRVRIDPKFATSLLVLDSSVNWNDNFGQNWFRNAMVGIGSMLGLERANDLPRSTLMAFTSNFSFPNAPTPEPIFPGNADILHGQHLYRMDGTDIDLYRFTIDLDGGKSGLFTAETFAERASNSSLLDTVVSLYRENPDGTRELIARNDDYYGRDSFVEMTLGAGTYYIGVSAGGNTNFDPTVQDSGIGGHSQGQYQLRLNFRSQVDETDAIRDADLTPTVLDGDGDGVPGGVYNFWFQTQNLNRVLEVNGTGGTFRDGQILTMTSSSGVVRRFEFDNNNAISAGNIRVAFGPSTTSAQMATTLANAILGAGIGINATASGTLVTLEGERLLNMSAGFTGLEVHGKTIFVDKNAGPNADGSLGRPFNNIARTGVTNAFAATQPGDIVRIVGNGGADGNLTTLTDNVAYEIGFSTLAGQILTDGSEMAVPKGVTVMIEPGTLFKLRRSWLGVGSSSLSVDRSGGNLQVLGTPQSNVYFTSWLDESIGRDTHPPSTIPARGDWGGIIFRNDVDSLEARPNLEDEGIFLNYVNHAQLLYGGSGDVVIDSVQQIVNPVQITQTRPTVTYNLVRFSADSAMSATPDSFDETNFHSPRYQSSGAFTSDYDRVGPEIGHNRVVNNSTNGLFVRINTPVGNVLQPLTVSGRFDDTDIVHVIAENLVIQGSQSAPVLDLSRPAVDLVTYSPRTGGGIPAGTYNYKLTFVDRNGFESRPSKATTNVTIGGTTGFIQLNQLPPATGDFVKRRVYRTSSTSGGVYTLVAELDSSDTVYLDTGTQLNSTLQRDPPDISAVQLGSQARGSLEKGVYNYRIVFVDADGREGASSDATTEISIDGTPTEGGIVLTNLPAATSGFVSRRLYRSTVGGISPYTLITNLDATSSTYVDDGYDIGGSLDPSAFGVVRARPAARLEIDPGTVVKLEGGRIEASYGAQFIAEGHDGQPVIFTSRIDDHYGAGGTFDTNDDGSRNQPQPGDWGGLFFGQMGSASIDHAVISYAGGINRISGTFTGFNTVEIHQADVRIANSTLENNALGIGGQGPLDRFGHGYNRPAVVFVRGAQPILLNNVIRDNFSATGTAGNAIAAITINANSLVHTLLTDTGRETGAIDAENHYADNHGPLIRGNRLDNNGLNGLVVRGEELTTESVWDDTDIVHILTNRYDRNPDVLNNFETWAFDEVVIPEFHTFGGLRLQSSPTESLVIKLEGAGNVNNLTNLNPTNGAGFTATGRPLGEIDRVGGTLEVVGAPGFPVVLTSIHDDTVGAGTRPDGKPQKDSNNNGIATIPRPNDWRSIRLDQNSNDRNVDIINEQESANETAPGVNALATTAQNLGTLAPSESASDDNRRLGFEIHGLLNEPNDIDVYSFRSTAGTEVWVDIDRTTYSLDTVVELLDANGEVLARTNDTLAESNGVEFISPNLASNLVNPLEKSPSPYYPTHVSGLPKDQYSTNPRDAGFRLSLPGVSGAENNYHLRVRSNNGLTAGVYQLQIRIREADEVPGSTVRYADIRYANTGIEVIGLPKHSPFLGESQENEETGGSANNNSITQNPTIPGNRPQDIGNLLTSDRGAISVAGSTGSSADVDFYQFNLTYNAVTNRTTHHGAAVFDVDYADSLLRPNTILSVFDSAGRLVLIGRDSNIAEDRPGPLNGADLADLSRGSVGPNDPYIGPVEMPEGQYFVAITSNAVSPNALNNALVRLEPLDTVTRIAEDHIASSERGTAEAPVVPVLLDPTFAGTGANLWHVTTDRSGDAGHGTANVFDGSRSVVASGSLSEVESNDSLIAAQPLDAGPWSLNFNANIGDTVTNTSTSIPHLSVQGTGDGTVDYYQFTVTQPSATVVLDIDNTFSPSGVADTELFLFDAAGNPVTLSGVSSVTQDDSPTTFGSGGSTSALDSYIQEVLTPGTYYVAVASFPSSSSAGGVVTGSGLGAGDLYTLQISVEGHATGGGISSNGGSSFYFGRGDQSPTANNVPVGSIGSLLSNPFSLKGYSATDLPVMYFNYFLDALPTSDKFRVFVVNNAGTSSLIASSNSTDVANNPGITPLVNAANNQWRQARVSLGAFAEQDNLRLRFDFDTVDANATNIEGAYIDDVIIGFAERGEMVSNAPVDATFAPNPAASGTEITTGDYQLELRRASEFGKSVNGSNISLVLTNTIDTNDRLTEQTTLVAPSGSQVVEGQTFTVSDGVNSITFEYEDPSIGNGVASGNVEIRFKTFNSLLGTYVADQDYVIARRIRDAINSPQVQTTLNLRAALSDGTITGTSSTDARVNLFGQSIVAVPKEFSVTETTNDGNALRDAIVGSGVTPVGNAAFVGSDVSAGKFEGGRSLIGMESGILLTTGDARVANGPNASDNSTGRASTKGDATLDATFGVPTRDGSSLQFDFQFGDGTVGGDLFLNFLFASEEYNERIGTPFSDRMAIYVDGVNIALVPSTSTPVSIDTVNSGNPFNANGSTGQNPAQFVNNDPNDNGKYLSSFGYDGFTKPFTAQALNLAAGVHTIKIAISDVGDESGDSAVFVEASSMGSSQFVRQPEGIPSIRHTGFGDQNHFRDQGQTLIHSNSISDTLTYGVLAEAGLRQSDVTAATTFSSPVRLLNPSPGPVRNLSTADNLPGQGGFAPGVIVSNNTVSEFGVAGIHIAGNSRPWEITPALDGTGTSGTSGDQVCDGDRFAVTSYGTTVTFEFEDIGGGPTTNCGSGTGGGNGWTEGNIPVFYRQTGATYTISYPQPTLIGENGPRSSGYSQDEMAETINDTIESSMLVINGTRHVIESNVGRSLVQGPGSFSVFVEDTASIVRLPGFRSNVQFRQASVDYAPQPFARVVNNTVYGDDGSSSRFPDAAVEPNDTIHNAIDTKQGRATNPGSFTANGRIGDSQNFRIDLSQDVDFYQFQMDIGDRVQIDIDSTSGLDSILRVFNAVGEEVANNNNGLAPGEAPAPGAPIVDPYIDFTATAPGTYYVGVSGNGNSSYSPISLANRSGPASQGNYSLNLSVLHPRQAVITARDPSAYADGTTFRIVQVSDLPGQTTNAVTFEFDTGNGVAAGNVAIPVPASGVGNHHPEMAVAITNAINNSPLTNAQSLANGAFANASPLARVSAEAIGGISRGQRIPEQYNGLDHIESGANANVERFVLVRNVVRIEDINSGLVFLPTPGNNSNDNNLLSTRERGILISNQATPTLLNNVLANTRFGVEQVAFQPNSPGPADNPPGVQGVMVEGASLYQYNAQGNSNIPQSANDFQIQLGVNAPLFVNAANGDFYPAPGSQSIDSAVDSVEERLDFQSIKSSAGISLSPILAPERDQSGQLRKDDPAVFTPSGTGANVFKDRGSLDRADFVGPSASLINPLDNDVLKHDQDAAISVVQLNDGVFSNFSIQLVDGFEAADPFPGVGINDSTVDGRAVAVNEDDIPLTLRGSAITVFEDGRFLREGIDYTFRYDTTSNTVRLSPLAGIWSNDKVYVIKVNNRDRFVIDAPAGNVPSDGDTFTITNADGDTATYEYDSGYILKVAPTLAVQVPAAGGGAGGITDGQRFTIDTGKTLVTFELDRNNNVQPGNRPVPFSVNDSASQIAASIVTALQAAVTAGTLPALAPKAVGDGGVHIGATPETLVNVTGSSLVRNIVQFPVGLVVPTNAATTITEGETFRISNGVTSATFEFDSDGGVSFGNRRVAYTTTDTADQIVNSMIAAVTTAQASGINLGLTPSNDGKNTMLLGGGAATTVDVTQSILTRTVFIGGVADGGTFTVRQGNNPLVRFEFDNDGKFVDANTDNLPDNRLITFSNADTNEDIAVRVSTAVANAGQSLSPFHYGGGSIYVGGTTAHVVDVSNANGLTILGQPGVQPSTTLQIPLSLGIRVPVQGGAALADGATFSITDGTRTVTFELDSDGITSPGSRAVAFTSISTNNAIAGTIAAEITASGLGLSAVNLGGGLVNLNSAPNFSMNLAGSGLTPEGFVSGLNDGDRFSIDDGTNVVTFEFEDANVNNGVAVGNVGILFRSGDLVDTIMNAMAAAIQSAGLGLPNAANIGTGQVRLFDSTRHITRIIQGNIVKSGVPGSAVSVNFQPNMEDDAVANAIVNAINQGQLTNVTAGIRGGSTLFVNVSDPQGRPADFVNSKASIAGISNFFLSAVEDIPGNTLKANQVTNETQFIILMPGVQLDFGDAPDPFAGVGRYPTVFADNGARHVITTSNLHLGTRIDADSNGQPTLAADGDDTDNVLNLAGTPLKSVSLAPYTIQVPASGGASITDGTTFSITRTGFGAVTFEFDNDSTVSNGNVPVPFTNVDTADTLAQSLADAIATSNVALAAVSLGGGQIFLGGKFLHSIDASHSTLRTEGQPVNRLIVPSGGASSVFDGQTVSFFDGINRFTLEFDLNNSGSSVPGSVPVVIPPTATTTQVATAVKNALSAAGLNIALNSLGLDATGNLIFQVSGTPSHTLDLNGSPISFTGKTPVAVSVPAAGIAVQVPAVLRMQVPNTGGSGINDGDRFIISDGLNAPVTFEFDRGGGVQTGNRRVVFGLSHSADTVAGSIVQAIQDAVSDGVLTNTSPVNQGGGAISVGGSVFHTLNTSASTLTQTGPVADGQTFVINDGIHPAMTFEFDRNGSVNVGNTSVAFSLSNSADSLVNAMVTAIKDRVNANQLSNVDPTNVGGGVLDMRAGNGVVASFAGSPGLTLSGTAGGIADGQTFTVNDGLKTTTFEFDRNGKSVLGNVVVPFSNLSTADQIAQSIAVASLSAGINLSVSNIGGGLVRFEGGDDDGVSFDGILSPGSITPITITSSGAGFVNAWIDFNQDGDWEDPGEEVLNNIPVVAGANSLTVAIPQLSPPPSTLPLGNTFARFRLSSAGNLLSTGLAVDGEVEDYRVRIISNESPIIIPPGILDQIVIEDSPNSILDLATFFDDPDLHNGNGDAIAFSIVANDNPNLVTASLGLDGHTLTLDYQDNANGTATIRIRATDHGGMAIEQPFLVQVLPINDTPIAFSDTVSVAEDTTLAINLRADDGDPERVQVLTYAIDIGASNGQLSGFNPATGAVSYRPNPNFNGIDTIVFSVTDDISAGGSARTSPRGTLTISVTAVNDIPVANTQSVSGPEDTNLSITLTGSDGDPEVSQALTFAISGAPTNGTIVSIDSATGAVAYKPNANFVGVDTFTFSVTDDGVAGPTAGLTSTISTVTVTITAVNDAPVASGQNVNVNEDTATLVTLVADDGDPEVTQSLTFAIVSQPTKGTLSAFDPATGKVTYTPNLSYNGPDTFSFQVLKDDGTAGNPADLSSNIATVTINVAPVNDPPVGTSQTLTTNEDTQLAISLTGDDGDPELVQSLTFAIGSQPANGTLIGFNQATGQVSYRPNASFNGVDTFTFTARDNGTPPLTGSPTTITITVAPVNDAPTATPVSLTIDEDGPTTLTLTGNDGDPERTQVLTFVLTTQPAHGTLSGFNAATGQVTYTPNADYNGIDSFTFTVTDDGTAGGAALTSAQAVVSFNINPINDAPQFNKGPNPVVDEDAGPQTILGWASGVRPGPLTASDEIGQTVSFSVTNSNNALFTTQPTVTSNGTLIFTPATNKNGTAVVIIQAVDNGSNVAPNVNISAAQTMTITVNAVNDAPEFVKGPNRNLNEDAGPQSIPNWATSIVPGPASATDEASQTVSFLVTNNNNGLFSVQPAISPDGTLTFTPAADANGVVVVTVRAQDSGLGTVPNVNTSAGQSFTIAINAVNDPPEFTAGPNPVVDEDAGNVSLANWATAIRPGPLTAIDEQAQTTQFLINVISTTDGLAFVTPPAIDPTNGTLTFRTAADSHGTATISLALRDNGFSVPPNSNTSATQTVVITVNSVNDAPQFTKGADQTVNEDAGPQSISNWATDIRPGPATASDENGQTVSFQVTNSNNALFALQPALNSSGTLTYTPAADANGVVTVTVTAIDTGSGVAPNQNSSSQTFTIRLNAVNDSPQFSRGPNVIIQEDVGAHVAAGWATGIRPGPATAVDESSQLLTFNLSVVSTNGALTFSTAPAIDPATGNLTFTTAPNANGTAVVRVTLSDNGSGTAPNSNTSPAQSFTISVTPVNDPPFVANPVADFSVAEDSSNTVIELFPEVFNDADVATNSDQLTFAISSNSNPNLVTTTLNGTRLTMAYQPNQNGTSRIVVQARDRNGATVEDTFNVTVTPVNDAPIVQSDLVVTGKNQPITFNPLANDVDVDGTINVSSLVIVSTPNRGTATVNANGTMTYTPPANFLGETSLRYTVQDDTGATSSEGTVTIKVNDPPVARDDSASTKQGTAAFINVLANDSDADGQLDLSSVTITSQPTKGTVQVNSTTGVVTYSPQAATFGTDTFKYKVKDDNGFLSNEATVTVNVEKTFSWKNPNNNLDVNADGQVTPLDALLVINYLNSNQPGELPTPSSGFAPPPYLDTTGDGFASAQDALLVINFLNSTGSGEGESGVGSYVSAAEHSLLSTQSVEVVQPTLVSSPVSRASLLADASNLLVENQGNNYGRANDVVSPDNPSNWDDFVADLASAKSIPDGETDILDAALRDIFG